MKYPPQITILHYFFLLRINRWTAVPRSLAKFCQVDDKMQPPQTEPKEQNKSANCHGPVRNPPPASEYPYGVRPPDVDDGLPSCRSQMQVEGWNPCKATKVAYCFPPTDAAALRRGEGGNDIASPSYCTPYYRVYHHPIFNDRIGRNFP